MPDFLSRDRRPNSRRPRGRLPAADDVSIPVQTQLIIELCSQVSRALLASAIDGAEFGRADISNIASVQRTITQYPSITEASHAYSMAWTGTAQSGYLRREDPDADLRQVRRRAVRARLRRRRSATACAAFCFPAWKAAPITQIKVHGAQHEFTTLPGVVEDMTDIVLNVKSLVVKNHSESTKRRARSRRTPRASITGADMQTDDAVEVHQQDHVIATLTDDVPFVMEMVVENGRGYVPATEHSPNVQEIGIIPIDAVYSPVVRVRYEIEETRVGQKTNYDKLTLEIWTNGSIASGNGAGRIGQDSPQAPQPVRAVHRAWARRCTLAGSRAAVGMRRRASKPS